jgi:tetratricopeptide (TPR) repeat protein
MPIPSSLFRYALVFAAAALWTGCSTSVRLKIQRAPELNLPGVKSLRLDPFSVSGDLNLNLVNSSNSMLGSLVNAAAGAGATKLGESKHPALQADHLQGLQSALFKNGFYEVNDGKGGKPIDAVVTGTVYYEVEDEGETQSEKDSDGKVQTWFEMHRKAAVTIRFNVARASGEMIGTSEAKGMASETTKDKTENDARNHVTPWEKVVRAAILNAQEPTVQKIAPYFVYERRTFEKGKSAGIKAGNKAAKDGQWDEAVSAWKSAGASGDLADQIASVYNLGIYHESQGDLPSALAKFEEAKQLSGKPKYDKDIRRTRGLIDDAQKIKEAETARRK